MPVPWGSEVQAIGLGPQSSAAGTRDALVAHKGTSMAELS